MSGETVTLPCGCVATYGLGHTHTKLCERHRREAFGLRDEPRPSQREGDNLDLVEGKC